MSRLGIVATALVGVAAGLLAGLAIAGIAGGLAAPEGPAANGPEAISPRGAVGPAAIEESAEPLEWQPGPRIAVRIPKPILTEDQARDALGRAIGTESRKTTGLSGPPIERSAGCLVQFDPAGCTRWYADGVRSRVSDGYLNVFGPESKTVQIHASLDPLGGNFIWISAMDPNGNDIARLSLSRNGVAEPYRRSREGEWDKIDDPDGLEALCLKAREDWLQIRDRDPEKARRGEARE